MADIQALRTFVGKELNAGTWKLTGPLTHDEIRILATQWMPELRFHEDEHFHPISYKDLLRLRDDQTLAGPYYLKTVSDSQPPRPTTTHPPVFFKSEEEKVSLN